MNNSSVVFYVPYLVVDIHNIETAIFIVKLEKWFPLQGERAHSLLLFVCTLIERRRRQNNNYRAINLPKAI